MDLKKAFERAFYVACGVVGLCGVLGHYPWWALVPAWALVWFWACFVLSVGVRQEGAAALAGVAALVVSGQWFRPLWAFMAAPSWDHMRAFVWNKGTLLVAVVYLVFVVSNLAGLVEGFERERRERLRSAFGEPGV